MAMDAYRRGDDVWVHLDLPGVAAESIDISLERNVLTVTADRNWPLEEDDQVYISERRQGSFSRQVHLGARRSNSVCRRSTPRAQHARGRRSGAIGHRK